MSEKSILEQALLQVQTLEEAVKHNAKGILASTMKQELNELLKEQEEEEDDDSPEDEEVVTPDESGDEEESGEEESGDEEDSDMDDESDESDNDELPDDLSKDIDSMDSDSAEMDTELPSMDELPSDDMEEPVSGDEDVMDMTGASDEEVLKVFKSMKPEDGIVVKKDGNTVELETGEDDFIIKLDESEDEGMQTETWEDETSAEGGMPTEEELGMEEETIYEIELDESDDEQQEEEEVKKVEATEAARTKSNPHGNKGAAKRAGLPSKKVYRAGVPASALNEEVTKLRKQNDEYKKALVLFKEKLNEVAVFNANLAYATRLFTEHSTTKSEKLNILKRFDNISTMNESKVLYNTIKTELETKKPVTESVVEKISNTPSTSTSQTTEVLSEAKAYENPQFRRMKDLMAKIK